MSMRERRTIDVHHSPSSDARAALRELRELIGGIPVAMLVTQESRGRLRAHPMTTLQSELEDELWFYVDVRSSIVDDITEHHQVNISYVDSGSRRYVSVAGIAQVVRDPQLLQAFWNENVATWLPNGPQQEGYLGLLRIQLEEAQYWDSTSRSMVSLRGLSRSDDEEAPAPFSTRFENGSGEAA
jgi:general stress protein 26